MPLPADAHIGSVSLAVTDLERCVPGVTDYPVSEAPYLNDPDGLQDAGPWVVVARVGG